jgi:hypothetical protein
MLAQSKALVPTGARVVLASARGGGAKNLHLRHPQLQRAAMISTWDHVRSSMWHPMATVEQSLMDMERMTSHLISGDRGMFPSSRSVLPRMHFEEDDFFKDLEVSSAKEAAKLESKAKDHHQRQQQGSKKEDEGNSYSSYSFSSSTVLDSQGHHVSTIRRRYEDSTGRLKALHEREIDGKKLKNLWDRKSPDDRGEHHTICHGGSAEEFEEQWKNTPFGLAEKGKQQDLGEGKEQKKVSESKAGGEHEKAHQNMHEPTSAFGADFSAANAAPHKESGKEAQGVTQEAQATTREEAIAQGSKRQEEETTLPQYSS